MKKKVLTAFTALGLLLGGMAAGSFFSSQDNLSFLRTSFVPTVTDLDDSIKSANSSLQGASAVQITQVHAELNTQMQLTEIRQNTEIIRLLTQIAAKK